MRISPRSVVLPVALILLDLLALNGAYLTALFLRFHDHDLSQWIPRFGLSYLYLLIATILIYLVLTIYHREYAFPRRFKPTHVLPRMAQIMLITVLISVMVIFLSKGLSRTGQVYHFSRPTLVAFWVIAYFYTSAGRFLIGVVQLYLFGRGFLQRPVLLAGEGAPMKDFLFRLQFNRWFSVRTVGTVVVRPENSSPIDPGSTHLAGENELAAHLEANGIHELFLAAPPDDLAQIFAITGACRRTGVHIRMLPEHLQIVISHILLSEALPVPDRTKEDLVFELYQQIDSRTSLDLATVAMIGAKGIPPTFGGIEHHVAELTQRLARQGFHVMVYSRPYYTSIEGRFQGVEIVRLPTIQTKHLDAITHTLLASLHIMFHKVDVAHYHAQGPSIFSFWPRLFGIRTVSTIHGLDWRREKWGAFAKKCLKLGELGSARFPTRTVTVSRTLKRYYEKHYNRQVTYIPNGIGIGDLPPPTEIKEKFGLESGSYALFVGRLVPEKGCHYLIEAFRQVKTDLKLVIAGGSSHSDEYAESLKELARGDDRVQFLGYVYGEALSELYTHSHIYVHPSDLEGLSIALLEALSFGACVLVSDIDENLEVLCDADTPINHWNLTPPQPGAPVGFRFKRSDVGDLTRTIQTLLGEEESVAVMRAKSRDWLSSRYDWDHVASETANVYLDIIRK